MNAVELTRNRRRLRKESPRSKFHLHLIGIVKHEAFDPGSMSSQHIQFTVIDEDHEVIFVDFLGLHHDLEESSLRLAVFHVCRYVQLVKDWKFPSVPGEPMCQMNWIRVGDSDDADTCAPQLVQELEDVLINT